MRNSCKSKVGCPMVRLFWTAHIYVTQTFVDWWCARFISCFSHVNTLYGERPETFLKVLFLPCPNPQLIFGLASIEVTSVVMAILGDC